MNEQEKMNFYDFHIRCIHPVIKSQPNTKPLWRRLYWSTAKNSIEYKCGCIDILKEHFPYLFKELKRIYIEETKFHEKQEYLI